MPPNDLKQYIYTRLQERGNSEKIEQAVALSARLVDLPEPARDAEDFEQLLYGTQALLTDMQVVYDECLQMEHATPPDGPLHPDVAWLERQITLLTTLVEYCQEMADTN